MSKFNESGIRGIAIDNGKCNKCIHVHDDGMTCDAFPDGIPGEILSGEFNHIEPYDGDNGIRFERNNKIPG